MGRGCHHHTYIRTAVDVNGTALFFSVEKKEITMVGCWLWDIHFYRDLFYFTAADPRDEAIDEI